MKSLNLSQGKVALVDDQDYERCAKYKWTLDTKTENGGYVTYYALRGVRLPDGRHTTQYLHRFILGVTDPKQKVDHRDRDGLNNCRSNLRKPTDAQSVYNRGLHRHNTSGFKGVCLEKRTNKWRSAIGINGRNISLGHFHSKIEAAKAYDTAALKYYGEYAVLNFPKKEVK